MTDIIKYKISSKAAFHCRKVFYSCHRDRIESNEKWFRRIEECVSGCDFGKFSDFMLVDKFISGLNDESFERFPQRQTLSIDQLTAIINDELFKDFTEVKVEPSFLSIELFEGDATIVSHI